MLFLLALVSVVGLGLATPTNYNWGQCLCLTGTNVNVRSSACGTKIGTASSGQCFTSKASRLTSCGYVWYKVNYNGKDGWIAGDYLVTSSSCSGSGSSGATGKGLCTSANIQTVGRVVHGEAKGESITGQLAVAYTIVNRVKHNGYPNTLNGVVYQRYSSGYQYNTLDDSNHDRAWASSKANNDATYRRAIQAAEDALCGYKSDPTDCATDYCAYDPCSATKPNAYWDVYNKKKIGSHWFVCRRSKTG
ncbi:uncharacterized protein LOC106178286 [Lingula anatina]|uniref:Uncharacterized protein LOC106178286 n=1 Tax=Lingula anatina TaxID=7574 RepID=A0A1S3K2J7_LINAN|nr:uncharacterized protein LOC106178286 [Lingula anatina]|eukprot:XP_013416863.1 uncharacterized protein LOC106178286 [Lingula anatina]